MTPTEPPTDDSPESEPPPAFEDDWPRPDPVDWSPHPTENSADEPFGDAVDGPGEQTVRRPPAPDMSPRVSQSHPARSSHRPPPGPGSHGGTARTRALAAIVAVAALVAVVLLLATSGSGSHNGSEPVTRKAAKAVAPSGEAHSTSVHVDGGTEVDPAYFATGSCVAFPPTSGNRHETVFVDAGHGGIDPGAVGTTQTGQTIYEADQTLPVELEIMKLLRAKGYRVVVSRTGASTVIRPQPGDVTGGVFTIKGAHDDVAARDVCANMAKANVLVGIYFDAGTSPTDAGSISAYDATRPFSADNQRLATLLQADVLAQFTDHGWSIPNDGVQTDDSLGGPPLTTAAGSYSHLLLLGPADPGYFSTPSLMPGALIEPLFITDPYEGTIAASTAGHQAIATGMAQAVEQYFQEIPTPTGSSSSKRKTTTATSGQPKH